MKRILLIGVGVVIGALATGTALAVHAGPGGGNPESVVAGTAKATNNVAACSQIGGPAGGGLCDLTIAGDYFDSGYLGSGKYSGKLVIDWSTYAANANDNNEMCASIAGPLTFTSGSSVLKVKVIGGASVGGSFPYSSICETSGLTSPWLYNRDYSFWINLVSGSGKYSHIVISQSGMGMAGQSFGELNSAQTAPTGTYLDQPNIATNFVVN
jgi:hypothetical protein